MGRKKPGQQENPGEQLCKKTRAPKTRVRNIKTPGAPDAPASPGGHPSRTRRQKPCFPRKPYEKPALGVH